MRDTFLHPSLFKSRPLVSPSLESPCATLEHLDLRGVRSSPHGFTYSTHWDDVLQKV